MRKRSNANVKTFYPLFVINQSLIHILLFLFQIIYLPFVFSFAPFISCDFFNNNFGKGYTFLVRIHHKLTRVKDANLSANIFRES